MNEWDDIDDWESGSSSTSKLTSKLNPIPDLRFPKTAQRHNHKSKPEWEYCGFSRTAPQYHVLRCSNIGKLGRRCGISTIYPCESRMLGGQCSVCLTLRGL